MRGTRQAANTRRQTDTHHLFKYSAFKNFAINGNWMLISLPTSTAGGEHFSSGGGGGGGDGGGTWAVVSAKASSDDSSNSS